MTVERDQIFLDPLANTPLKIWEVQSGSMHRLKEEGWEPKLRLTSKEEQVQLHVFTVYTHTHTNTHTHTHTCMYVCVYVCIHMYVFICMYVCICVY